MVIMWVLIVVAAVVLLLAGSSVRVITQFERGVVLRFGQLRNTTRGPGLTLITPIADRLHKVNMQIITMPVPAQEGITRDNVTVRVDAVVYYRVLDPTKVVVDVQNYEHAIGQVAQASLAPSSAKASWTTCYPTANDSTRASNSCSTPPPWTGACRSTASRSKTSPCPNR